MNDPGYTIGHAVFLIGKVASILSARYDADPKHTDPELHEDLFAAQQLILDYLGVLVERGAK